MMAAKLFSRDVIGLLSRGVSGRLSQKSKYMKDLAV